VAAKQIIVRPSFGIDLAACLLGFWASNPTGPITKKEKMSNICNHGPKFGLEITFVAGPYD
jgi:hypothetical protein